MIIAPSVLSLDYTKFKEQVDELNYCVDWLHFDVMDGHFVPNLSFGPDILNAFRRSSNLFLDTHLMITDPNKYVDRFIDAGSDLITFHYEAMNSIEECVELINKIHSKYVRCGISIKLPTTIEQIKPLLDKVDMVLIMSIEPGFGGQKFTDEAHDKIVELDEYRKANNLEFLIEVDGGVNDFNARQLVNEGVDVLVAGSFIFKGKIQENVEKLKRAK